MNSSGIKRGLATTAISALAVTGLPFLASSASAEPIEEQYGDAAIEFYAPAPATAVLSTTNDGTNTTASLVVGGGADVTQVLFQYQATSTGATWNDVPGGAVARNADGVFATDWSNPPADLTNLRAVPNTEDGNALNGVETVTKTAATRNNTTASTVELGTEGSLGVFQSPYSAAADGASSTAVFAEPEPDGEYAAVRGTTSEDDTTVTVSDVSHEAQTGGATVNATAEDADGTTGSGTTGAFEAILDIAGYDYSQGGEPNQIALNALTTNGTVNTDDAEGSTLYVQEITTITADPTTVELQGDTDTENVTLTVTDQFGEPVANAQVATGADTDTDTGTADSDTDGAERLVGYTDANGQITTVAANDVDGPGNFVYYVNTTDDNDYEPGVDKAVTVTATEYTPAFSSIAIVNERSHSNFDLDELADGDDFTIETRDQRGNLITERTPQYRWVIDPTATGQSTFTGEWVDATLTATAGTYSVALPESYNGGPVLPEGSYTLEARRPNLNGSGLTNAAPVTVAASESEITWAEGDEATAPVEGDVTLDGTLANAGGALAGREVTVNLGAGREDSRFAPQAEQPSGVTRVNDTQVTVITDAGGDFAVKIDDPEGPAVVADNPEDVTVTAEATGEDANDVTDFSNTGYGLVDGGSNDAADSVVVHFAEAADVDEIEINLDDIANGYAPGRPVDLDIIVRDADGNALTDQPVDVSVDKGFLSPNAETADDLNLAEGHDQTGDLWGFFQNDGTSETVTTGDDPADIVDADPVTPGNQGQVVEPTGGIVAAIERDAGFDDDGLVTMTITVTSGDVTETRTVEFDARNVVNLVEGDLDPADGEPTGQVPVTEDVSFQLYTFDQFENLVGDRSARISDDSTVADFRTDGDFGSTLTDFVNDGAGITAFSDEPTTQTLTARVAGNESLVGANESQATDSSETLSVDSDPIEWVAGGDGPINAGLTLRGGDNGAADDSLFANAHRQTEGAVVKLFRRKSDGTWKFIRKGIMNAEGNFRFKNVNDLNGNKVTRYKAIVKATDDTRRGVGKKRVR